MFQSIKNTSITTVKRIEGTRRGVAELPVVVDPESVRQEGRGGRKGEREGEGRD